MRQDEEKIGNELSAVLHSRQGLVFWPSDEYVRE